MTTATESRTMTATIPVTTADVEAAIAAIEAHPNLTSHVIGLGSACGIHILERVAV